MSTKTLHTTLFTAPTSGAATAVARPRPAGLLGWTGQPMPTAGRAQGTGLSVAGMPVGTAMPFASAPNLTSALIPTTPVQDGDAAVGGVIAHSGVRPRGAPA